MSGKYQTYPAYKDSGVEWLGEVPEHWEIKRLGQFFEERREKVSDKNYAALSVTMKGIVPQLENAAKSDDGDNRKLVLKDDFVINSRSDRKGSSGVSPYNGSVSLISIVLKPKRIQPAFVHHLFRSYPFQEEFYRYGKGIVADLWSTNSSEMKSILITEMPETEQQKIAQFLDHETAKIDTLIEKQQRLIELLKEKRQAVISHAVTKGLNPNAPMKDSGVEWLGEVPEHWEVMSLKYLSAFVGTGGTPKDESSFSEIKDIHWFSPVDFRGDILLSESSKHITSMSCVKGDAKLYKSGSVLIVGIGATLGKVGLCMEEFSCNQQINIITPNEKMNGIFMTHSLTVQTEQMKQLSNASAIGIMNQEKTKLIKLAAPSISEQIEINNFIQKMYEKFNTLLNKTYSQIELMQERRTALISAAVTGKIDVREWRD
ncbi:restriction modification system DNA specificity domain-containing protein [Methylococcaceae bacterium]|nr:restriction modification system DNA specificity domain-containing protein [Methylococcaceae bacterium]